MTNRWAAEGKEAYTEKLENLRGLVGGLDTYYLVAMATKKLGITAVRELRDKKVPVRIYTQPVGSLGEFAGRQLLRAVGLGYNEVKGFGGSTQHVGYNVIIDAFKDGRADLLIAVVTPKHPSVSEIVSSVDVEFLGLDAETAKALLPLGYTAATMPPDTFKNQAKPVSTVGFPTVLITNKDLPEPIAYTVTKTVVENKDALVRGHGGLAEFDPQHGVAARQGRHSSASGRRAGVPREGVDEIAADLVFDNGHILTLDPRRPVVAALAVAGGRVLATGGRGDVRRWRDRRTKVLDLRGATVIPGLVDAHAHLDREGLKLIYPSLARCRSIADIQQLIRRLAAGRKPGEWIVTMPIGSPPFYQDAPSGLAEGRWPTRAELDAAAPEHPVYVRGIWGYWNRPPVYSVANSRALTLAGITGETAAPSGVDILKDAAGQPTGVFVERNAIQVLEFTLMRAAPRFTPAERLRALRESQRRYAARGVTAVYEGHGIAPEVLATYRESHARGELTLRCSLAVSPTWEAAEAARAIPALAAWAGGRGLGDDRLRVGRHLPALRRRRRGRAHPARRRSPTRAGRASWRAPTTPPPTARKPSWPQPTGCASTRWSRAACRRSSTCGRTWPGVIRFAICAGFSCI